MIAATMRLALLAAACIAVGGAFWIPLWWSPLFVVLVPAALVAALAWVLALEFILAAIAGGTPGAPAPPGRLFVRAWWLEVGSMCRLVTWRIPFCSDAHRQTAQPYPSRTRGVVLVHGYGCNRAVWSAWLTQLVAQRVPCIAVNLEPPFAAIENHRNCVAAAVLGMQRQTGLAPVLVGHSMGGLVARVWWVQAASASSLHRLLTIATPHQGTETAKFGWGPNARQMRPDSDWLRRLAAQESAAHAARTLCFYSACDNIVVPSAAATLPGADNREIAGTGHVALVDHPEIFAATLRCLSNSD